MNHNYDFEDDIVITPADIIVLKDLDVEYQLAAIERITKLHLKYKLDLDEEIKRREFIALNNEGKNNDWEVDWHIEAIHESIYADGALCLSFVGLIVPLIETIFVMFFKHIGKNWKDDMIMSFPRWQNLNKNDFWDCRKFLNNEMKQESDIKEGILQLCECTRFNDYLAPKFSKILTILFKFRNNLFHNGMEWPINKRKEFQRLLNDMDCNQYFSFSTSAGEPWIFSMTDECINYCQSLVKDTYYSMNKYCMDNDLL